MQHLTSKIKPIVRWCISGIILPSTSFPCFPHFCSLAFSTKHGSGRAVKNKEGLGTLITWMTSDGHKVDVGGRGPHSNNVLYFIIERFIAIQDPRHIHTTTSPPRLHHINRRGLGTRLNLPQKREKSLGKVLNVYRSPYIMLCLPHWCEVDVNNTSAK